MKFKSKLSVSILLVGLSFYACNSSQSTAFSNGELSSSGNPKESAVLWQQTSAEYTALCYQAFNAALDFLANKNVDEMVTQNMSAIVMDLDETVVDNSPYNGYLIENNQSYDRSSWMEWTNRAEAELVPGALEFINYARELGYEVYFISNRTVEELEVTLANLRLKGIDVSADKVLLKSGDSGDKKERRDEVIKKHGILMLIGDNLADFDDAFEEIMSITMRKDLVQTKKEDFGRRFIILPNAMYGAWEKTLTIYDKKSIQNENAKGARKYLKSFN